MCKPTQRRVNLDYCLRGSFSPLPAAHSPRCVHSSRKNIHPRVQRLYGWINLPNKPSVGYGFRRSISHQGLPASSKTHPSRKYKHPQRLTPPGMCKPTKKRANLDYGLRGSFSHQGLPALSKTHPSRKNKTSPETNASGDV